MSKDQFIVELANENRYELGLDDSAAFELAELQYEDIGRKGCVRQTAKCAACGMNGDCPMLGWEIRHPEYRNDELARKIRRLEAGEPA